MPMMKSGPSVGNWIGGLRSIYNGIAPSDYGLLSFRFFCYPKHQRMYQFMI